MAEKEFKRYSLTFKQQVVREYEGGASVPELMRKYGIGGKQTIRTWVKQHSRKGSEMREATDRQMQGELENAKEKIEGLEKLVAQLSLDKFMLESCLKVAERELGYEVKKNDGTKQSGKRSGNGRRA